MEERIRQLENESVILRERVRHIDETVKDIQSNVSNHIPTKLCQIEDRMNENQADNLRYREKEKMWLVGLLVTLIFLLLGTICNLAVMFAK